MLQYTTTKETPNSITGEIEPHYIFLSIFYLLYVIFPYSLITFLMYMYM